MKVLHVSMRYDYGDRNRGESYEWVNWYDSLRRAGYDVEFFDYMEEIGRLGRDEMNHALLQAAERFGPDVAIVSLYTDQLLPETMLALKKVTKTLCFFHDDTWRRDFCRFWSPHFDYVASPDFECKRKYRNFGSHNVIHFPYGANEALYKPLEEEKQFDVSFVGQWHPYREWLVRRLRSAGIQVEAVGFRWPKGVVSHDGMIRIFNRSRINLNLSNTTSWDIRYLTSSLAALRSSLRSAKTAEQLKARHFEIPACAAFQLSYYVDGLERYYRIGEEIAVFLNPDDLVEKVRSYLQDRELMDAIAAAAYRRTLSEHTYAQRFKRVFGEMGVVGPEGARS